MSEANLKALPQTTGRPHPARPAVNTRVGLSFPHRAAHTPSTGWGDACLVPGYLSFRVTGASEDAPAETTRAPGLPGCGHTWTPRPSRPLLARPGSSSGSPRAGRGAGRARSLGRGSPRRAEKVPPPRRRRPGAPLAPLAPHAPHAPRAGRKVAERGGARSSGTVAGAGG